MTKVLEATQTTVASPRWANVRFPVVAVPTRYMVTDVPCVVGGQVVDAACDDRPQRPHLLIEPDRVIGHRRIGDHPGLSITPPHADG